MNATERQERAARVRSEMDDLLIDIDALRRRLKLFFGTVLADDILRDTFTYVQCARRLAELEAALNEDDLAHHCTADWLERAMSMTEVN